MTVELYDPKRNNAPQPAGTPHLVYSGGPLLTHAEVFAVFMDAGSGYPYTAEMRSFITWLLTSDAVSLLAEYNTGLGKYTGDVTLKWGGSTPPPPPPPPPPGNCDALLNAWLTCMFGFAPPAVHAKRPKHKSGSPILPHRKHMRFASQVVTDAQIEQFIADNITSGTLPVPNSQTLYATYWPDGITIQFDSQNSSCQQFCGYHNSFNLSNGTPVRYAVLPYPSCAGCLGGMTAINALTTVTTHEIRESMTDAGADGSGWYDQANGEADDICAWKERVDAGYTVQLEWSNKRNACI
jgi:hypothetical protein